MGARRTLVRLRALEGAEAELELIESLTASSPGARLAALQGLARHGSSAALPAAERFLELEIEPFLRAHARLVLAAAGQVDREDLVARALGRRGLLAEASWPLRPQLGFRWGEGWPMRRLAVAALSALGERELLLQVLRADPDWAVRCEAARGLGDALDPQERQALERALEDPHRAVRVAAAKSVGLQEPDPRLEAPEALLAWRVPGHEPVFRYLAGSARREYADELDRGTRDGVGRNWATFDHFCELDMGEEPPEDVELSWPLVQALGDSPAPLSLARDLAHHPGVAWGDQPSWPVCCGDYTIFYGHDPLQVAPREQVVEEWFLESLVPGCPEPEGGLGPDLEGDTYAFRCGYCGGWWTVYEPGL